MAAEQCARITAVYDQLESLYERVTRRCASIEEGADQYINSRLLKTMEPLRDDMRRYRDFHQTQVNKGTPLTPDDRGQLFEMIEIGENTLRMLALLAENTLNRGGKNVPGSLQRLSPMFHAVVMREKAEIGGLQDNLRTAVRFDVEVLKTLLRTVKSADENTEKPVRHHLRLVK